MEKNINFKVLLVILSLFFTSISLFAQLPPTGMWPFGLTASYDPPNRICNLSDPAKYGASMRDSTLTLGDSIVFTYYFGNGDSAIGFGIADTSEFIIIDPTLNSHYYAVDGIYNYTVKALNTSTGITTYSNNNLNFYMGIDCGQIWGYVYNDCNLNCIMSGNEGKLDNVKVIHLDTNDNRIDSAYTNFYGNFSFNIQVGTPYKLIFEEPENMNFNYSCPSNGIFMDTIVNSGDLAYIGVTYNNYNDLRAHVGGGFARPGDVVFINLRTSNNSCSNSNGVFTTLQINSPLLSFLNAVSVIPVSSTNSTVNWSGLIVPANGEHNLWVKLFVDSTAQIGDTLCFSYTVGPDTIFTINNQKTVCLVVQNSWDPNMKEVYPIGIGAEGYIPENTEFTYTIHFQNTGTAQANTISLSDSIDANLDISTFEALSASHPYSVVLADGLIRFIFNNIYLPDSATNPAASNGSVTFKIKAKPNLGEGTEIKNKAYIYFDQNAPIVTNTTLNTIELITNLSEFIGYKSIKVMPNPTDGLFEIFVKSKIESLRILDFTGRVVMQQFNINANSLQIDLSNFRSGIYIVQTIEENSLVSQTKLIKK